MRNAVERVALRLLAASAGAAVAGLLVAACDARAVTVAASVPFPETALATAGLIAPLALGVGLGGGVALSALLPAGASRALLCWLRPDDMGLRRERALALALLPFAGVLWFLIVARWTLFVFASNLEPSESGALIGLSSVLLGAVLALCVPALARSFGSRVPARFAPLPALAGSLLASVVFLAMSVVTGTPSGAGGVLSMLGVLTRDELDLRPALWLLLLSASALAMPRPERVLSRVAYGVLALAPLLLTLRAAGSGLASPQLALSIERSAPLGSRLLRPLRRLTDRDHDGYSARFGGGDCDDRLPEVNPGADDVPENGRDEDCSGSDARAVAVAVKAPELVSDARAAALSRLPEHLNVVLLTVDTLRYDLGYAGNPRRISPELDRLAAESVVFERAYSLASYTAKSLPPMLIGRYSSETHRGYSHFNRFEKSDPFLAERLTAAGVHTVSVQGHWYFFQNYGMERGFSLINSSAAPRAAQAAEGDRSVTSERISDAVIAELGTLGGASKQFFLWAHYTDPHAEYVEHEGFSFGAGSRAAYDGEVAFVDHHVGRVLAALRQSPLWANTVILVTSDHGEAFGEHGMIRHGFELWEELVRVPLLVRVPGLPPHRVVQRRSAIDLVPTVLELFRVPLPAAGAEDFLSGSSLLLDLALPPGYVPSARPVFVDMAEGPHNAERRAFIEGDTKLVLSGGRALGLYDLAADPAEKRDLSANKADLEAALERFRAFRRGLHEVSVRAPR
jgi:arylsulfatase A-like enzyme